jgi:hypothetical protein
MPSAMAACMVLELAVHMWLAMREVCIGVSQTAPEMGNVGLWLCSAVEVRRCVGAWRFTGKDTSMGVAQSHGEQHGELTVARAVLPVVMRSRIREGREG